jgi:pimeloyl-ACP methyl ester carboxylesterase/tetratricopeptide (TPR) repeat protein
MGIVFNVPGHSEGAATSRSRGQPDAVTDLLAAVKQSVHVVSLRAGGTVIRTEAVPGEDVVRLKIAGGPELVLHPENARDLLRAQSVNARGNIDQVEDGEVAVPVHLGWQGLKQTTPASRGALGDVVLAGFEVLGLKERVAHLTAQHIVVGVDGQVVAGLHLLRRQTLEGLDNSTLMDQRVSDRPLNGPLLVLIHGTFSSTKGTFGQLWHRHNSRVEQLFNAYGDRVYALEHKTLSQSPIQNARDLARSLPTGATLHLLTHSRGGLVAEVLARACALETLGERDRALFQVPTTEQPIEDGNKREALRQQRQIDLAALEELLNLTRDKRLRVERVVRVACPSRGTLLASKRLDAYLSVFKWTLQLAGIPVAPQLVSFLTDVARQRFDADLIPGLAAQVPDSPLVQWLHQGEAPVPGSLRVVAGDMQGDSVSSWLKTLIADAFYWTDNDLVVQTRSMYGGMPRATGAAFVLDRGSAVSHFGYFSNETTVLAIVEALLREIPKDFRPIGALSWAGQDASGIRGASRTATSGPATSKPALVLLPGIVGSNLKAGGDRIWLSWRLVNGLRRLSYQAGIPDDIDPDGVIGRIYDSLIVFLSSSHEVIAFDFDWRLPIEEEARRLGNIVQEAMRVRATNGQPVRLLAHSMGGLVARVMQLECPDIWKAWMAHPSAKLLMLGTPNGGSWAPMQVLSGDDTFGNTLTAFGAPFQDRKARQMMAEFPGLLQMQRGLLDPDYGLDREATWRKLADDDFQRTDRWNLWHIDSLQLSMMRWGVPPQAVLDAAVALRKRLDKQLETLPTFADRLLLVLGSARRTPDGWQMTEHGLEYLDALNNGDGRVLDHSARLPGVRTWRVDTSHGDLPTFEDAHVGYLELLEKGNTTCLVAVPELDTTRGIATPQHVPGRPSREQGVMQTTPGLSSANPMETPLVASDDETQQRLLIRVINGDLGFVSQPLLVGHYTSLGITGSEKDVDRHLGGSLQRSLATGLYPQEIGTLQIFHNTRLPPDPWRLPQPQAVIVVGLGPEGKLRPADLVRAVRTGVLSWAMRLAEMPDLPPRFELAATLMGSGGVGIVAGQSAQLVAQGVREANERLQAATVESAKPLPQISTLVLVERYLDRATDAWRALTEQAQSTPDMWNVAPAIEQAASGLERPIDASYRGADYDLIMTTAQEDVLGNSAISYRIDTRRARSEVLEHKTQGRLLRQLVAGSVEDNGRHRNIGRTLFQLLVPLGMEPFLNSSTDTQIEMDEGSAAIPWELLDTPLERDAVGATGQRPPWAIRTKLLRKLRSADFRMQVSDAGRDAGVLVIGEPSCPKGYPRLPGARREARGVFGRLQVGGLTGPVRELIASDDETTAGANATTVINTLLERDWRIIHIAGHGEAPLYDDALPYHYKDNALVDDESVSSDRINKLGSSLPRLIDPRGVVLSDGIFLGPREIASMQIVPELVFVNCCFSGARRSGEVMHTRPANLADISSRPGFAAGVAQELIRIGVRCVVATGWAVDDAAAEAFAIAFYGALLRGSRFIEAVYEARKAAHAMGGNTWGAYQCYGDPNWTLLYGMPDAQSPVAAQAATAPECRYSSIASAQGLVLALDALAVQATYGSVSKEEVSRDLKWLQEHFHARWGAQGRVAEAFGMAFKALGQKAEAIEWYQKALQASDGCASLKSSEYLFNLSARSAWEPVAELQAQRAKLHLLLRRGQNKTQPNRVDTSEPLQANIEGLEDKLAKAAEEALAPLDAALAGLERLVALRSTSERESLCGSACKRLAQAHALAGHTEDAKSALQRMKAYYTRAREKAEAEPDTAAFYPAINLLAAQIAVERSSVPTATVQGVRDLAVEHHQRQPGFWSAVALVEIDVWSAFINGKLQLQQEVLEQAFQDLHDRVPDPIAWASVLDQARFLVNAFFDAADRNDTEAAAAQALLDRLAAFAFPATEPSAVP